MARPRHVRPRARDRPPRERAGERPVIVAGIALNLASLAVARAGTGVEHFWLALLLVGVGWNCMFVAGSAMVTRTYTTAERARAQGANELLVFGTVALTSAAGQLLHLHGWHAVLAAALPLLLVALVAGLWPVEAGTSAPRVGIRSERHASSLTSASTRSSQYVMPISRYIVVAVARCSRAGSRLPIRG